MSIKNTRGGLTFPKRGRLGSGAYWPRGTPIAGNVFGPNADIRTFPAPNLRAGVFGAPSNAGNGTQNGQDRTQTGAGMEHPNAPQRAIAQHSRGPVVAFSGQGLSLSADESVTAASNPRAPVQPHERNYFGTRERIQTYKMAFGAGRAMPADTAFRRLPTNATPTPAPQGAVDVFALRDIAAFRSQHNQWADPNNSYLGGKPQPLSGETGRARWATVKRGAAG